jgi:hypothetical protein
LLRLLASSCCISPKDAPRRGVAEVLSGVGALVFDDRLHALMRRHEVDGGAAAGAVLRGSWRCRAIVVFAATPRRRRRLRIRRRRTTGRCSSRSPKVPINARGDHRFLH